MAMALLLLSVLATYRTVRRVRGCCWREAALGASCLIGAYGCTVTELLSFGKLLAKWPLVIAWGCWLLGCVIVFFRTQPPARLTFEKPTAWEWAAISVVAVVLVPVAWLAYLAPPINHDVCVYHLPRVLLWQQAACVDHVPAQDYRLLNNPPLAEFSQLQLMILAKSDRWANLPGFSAYILAGIAISLLARDGGASRATQWLAALVWFVLPIAVHQATNPKNDLLVASWLVIALVFARRDVRFAGLALGLMIATKGTGYLFAVPAAVYLFVHALDCRKTWWLLALGGLVLPVLPHTLRNITTFGNLTGPNYGLTMPRHDPLAIASNILRNGAMHLATPSETANAWLTEKIREAHLWRGLSPEEPSTTWGGSPFAVKYEPRSEEFATAPLHLLLACGSFLLLFRHREWRPLLILALGTAAMFVVFLKWQSWHPRLHSAIFSLLAAPSAVLLAKYRLVFLFGLLSLVGVWLAVAESPTRALTGRGWNLRQIPREQIYAAPEGAVAELEELVQFLAREKPSHVEVIADSSPRSTYAILRRIRNLPHTPTVGYFFPVPEVPSKMPSPELVLMLDLTKDGECRSCGPFRRPGCGTVYRTTERIGPWFVFRPAPAGTSYNKDHQPVRFAVGP